MWPATFGLACCAIEMMATGAAHYDTARFGMEVFRASPRQADLMIVAGRVSPEDGPGAPPGLRPDGRAQVGHLDGRVREHAAGCSTTTRIVQGVDQIVPVDVYVPGCPPGPETLLHGILTLHEMIRTGEIMRAPRGVADAAVPPSTSTPTRPRRPAVAASASAHRPDA